MEPSPALNRSHRCDNELDSIGFFEGLGFLCPADIFAFSCIAHLAPTTEHCLERIGPTTDICGCKVLGSCG